MSAGRPPRRQSRLADQHPAYPTPAAVPDPEPEAPSAPAAAGPGASTDAPMPAPRRRKVVRVQLNTRIRQDLHDRLQAFVDHHDAAVQDVVEDALAEYLDRRASS